MDAAAEENDIVLQKSAAGYLAELHAQLPKLLFRTATKTMTTISKQRIVRKAVRVSATAQLCNLLEPFQEWPQLLDPHLAGLISPLQEALRECILNRSGASERKLPEDGLLVPLDQAVCKLLYTLCKVRGAKVVSRFLDSAVENLEPVLNALEVKIQPSSEKYDGSQSTSATWEEKYVYMLWLWHLLFAPFDLTTIGSSEDVSGSVDPDVLRLPSATPDVAVRVVRVSVMVLKSPSKEREAAVKLLSRLVARPDMVHIGLHDCLFTYALSSLENINESAVSTTLYDLIGYLSLLTGMLSTLDASTLKPYLLAAFKHMLTAAAGATQGSNTVTSTAVARKLVVKSLRLLSTLALQLADESHPDHAPDLADYILEETIDHLLNSLADQDTPVRQAASKALSVIASKLGPELAADIVEAVIGSLDENVLWLDDDPQVIKPRSQKPDPTRETGRRDVSAVNPLRWHGLVLTLSQLIFQHSAPASHLPSIINSLALALSFEQRSSSGNSVGGNVRDAANFGIWSLARKFSTEELLLVRTETVRALRLDGSDNITVIQAMAAELIVAATLDPAGNIRRGSSAALQELIGRHPDMVFEGIPVVQVVDYHAVALRSRAFSDVAIRAASLHGFFCNCILRAMMSWRGLEAADAPSRRLAAQSIALLSQAATSEGPEKISQTIHDQLNKGRIRNVERRHGLFLAASSVLRILGPDSQKNKGYRLPNFWIFLIPDTSFTKDELISHTRRPELTAEALSELIGALSALSLRPDSSCERPTKEALGFCLEYLGICLGRREPIVISAASKGAKEVFPLLEKSEKGEMISRWIGGVKARLIAPDTGTQQGYISALGSVYEGLCAQSEQTLRDKIIEIFLEVLRTSSADVVDMRVAALAALRDGILGTTRILPADISAALMRSLQDYTVNKRGDIGSLVRLEALSVLRKLLGTVSWPDNTERQKFLGIVATLAGEKLDKVRFHAWNSLEASWSMLDTNRQQPTSFATISQTASTEYFSQLLWLLEVPWLQRFVLQGICVSAGSGSESILRTSRTALVQHCISSSTTELLSIATSLLSLLQENTDQERLTVALLETWAFLLQSTLLSVVQPYNSFSLSELFAAVQKTHYKSGNTQKLTAAIQVYGGLASHSSVRQGALKKLASMLLHPLPRVRSTAADVLYLVSQSDEMLAVDWSKAPKDLKGPVQQVRAGLEVA